MGAKGLDVTRSWLEEHAHLYNEQVAILLGCAAQSVPYLYHSRGIKRHLVRRSTSREMCPCRQHGATCAALQAAGEPVKCEELEVT